jgi:YegS/Rv2252/BmrU family lipid kinase
MQKRGTVNAVHRIMSRALLLINPGSRSGEDFRPEARRLLAARGLEIIEPEQVESGAFPNLIHRYRHLIDRVIVGGGDGSVNCAAAALAGTGLPLGILPLGTANNVARSLGLPESLEEACGVIAEGERRPMDLGRVNGHHFVSVAGIGLSTRIHAETPDGLKKRLGPLAYAVQGVRVLRSMTGFFASVRINQGPRLRLSAFQISVCNGRYFGGSLEAAEDATLADGRLDVVILRSDRWTRGMWRALTGRARPHEEDSPLLRIRARSLEIGTWPPMRVDVEGKIATRTPAAFDVLPGALTVLAPAESGARAA